ARRRLLADDERSPDGAVVGANGAVAVRPPDVLEASVALDREILVLVPRRWSARHHLFDLRSDGIPDVGPALPPLHAQSARVSTTAAEARPICVVVDLRELRSPPQEHRSGGVEDDADDRPEA